MNLEKIRTLGGPRVGLATLALKKHSPEIMIVSGLGSGVAAAILLAKAHKKSEETFSDVFEQLDEVRTAIEENNELVAHAHEEEIELPEGADILTAKDSLKACMPLYIEVAKRAVTLYGPAVLFGTFSVAMIIGSHGLLKRRNRALFSTVVLLERSFSAYRERVRKELGEDGDERFLYGLEKRKKTIVTTDENGKKKKKSETENALGEELTPIMYQRKFDQNNVNWGNAVNSNFFWLGTVQQMMNDRLEGHGYVLLNDVYKVLGFGPTWYGAVVGWSLAAPGDNFVDFGAEKAWNEHRGDGAIMLDFNVNGAVYEYIGLTDAFKSPTGE